MHIYICIYIYIMHTARTCSVLWEDGRNSPASRAHAVCRYGNPVLLPLSMTSIYFSLLSISVDLHTHTPTTVSTNVEGPRSEWNNRVGATSNK